MFIMVDGVDGTGKSTVVHTMAEGLAASGKRVFHLKQFWTDHGHHVKPHDLADYDVIVSAEPTYVGMGSIIRKELIRHGAPYSGTSVAHAFALDREILYRALLIPLLAQGKTILQDRGVSTSLCFQPIQDPALSRDFVAGLPGNTLALTYRPDHLIITDAPVTAVLSRIGGRYDKQDDARFETEEFIRTAKSVFLDPSYQSLFRKAGTTVHVFDTNVPLDVMKQNAVQLVHNLFTHSYASSCL